jgi:purine-binding chemotaxis protein CheW
VVVTRQLSTFFVDDLFLAVDALNVQEVLRFLEMTPVPLAPPMVRGLINLRGQIVAAVDLRCRLDLPERDSADLPTNVVVRTEDGALSLLVDEIGDVLEVNEELFEKPPATTPERVREVVSGVYKLSDRLLLVLDPEKVADVSA